MRSEGSRGVRRAGVAAAFAVLVSLALPPDVASAQTAPIPGVDVSQWQQTIDWSRVNTEYVRFVIIRATRGEDYVDPMYAANVAGADPVGVIVGAYHRATPSAAPNDALIEANHYLSVARNAPGDVLPALDIEETGGLSPAALEDWVRTWVLRVRKKLGVRSLLYASPYFWRTNMGDTTWFARKGYPLWIAHWGVSAPDVPAGDWLGRGWTYWQFTNAGTLTGIPTNVDRDRFNGDDLTMGTIASVTVEPPQGGSVTGSRLSCGGTGTKCARLANPGDTLTLTATPDPDASFVRWDGACAAAGSAPTCSLTTGGARQVSAVFAYPVTVTFEGTGAGTVGFQPGGDECGTTCTELVPAGTLLTLSATPDSASGFGTWGGACAGSTPSCAVTVDRALQVSARFDATVQLEEDDDGTSFTWGATTDTRAIGGSYRWDRRAGASVTFPFRGGAVSLFTVSGPAMGKALVSVDGEQIGRFNGYARSVRAGVVHRYEGLSPGRHLLTVTATGTGPPKAKGTRVAVDAIRWGGKTRSDPISRSATWGRVSDGDASGGAYAITSVNAASTSLRFTGTGVTLLTVRGPSMGRAQIRVDGAPVRTIDLYAPAIRYGVQRSVTGLSDDTHLVQLVVLGSRRKASTGTDIAVDGWIVS